MGWAPAECSRIGRAFRSSSVGFERHRHRIAEAARAQRRLKFRIERDVIGGRRSTAVWHPSPMRWMSKDTDSRRAFTGAAGSADLTRRSPFRCVDLGEFRGLIALRRCAIGLRSPCGDVEAPIVEAAS